MRVNIYDEHSGQVMEAFVEPSDKVDDLFILAAAEFSIQPDLFKLRLAKEVLDPSKHIHETSVADNCLLEVCRDANAPAAPAASSSMQRQGSTSSSRTRGFTRRDSWQENLRDFLKAGVSPEELMQQVAAETGISPEAAALAAQGGSPSSRSSGGPHIYAPSTQAEVQRRLREMTQLRNIDRNYEMAMELTPEAFARVVMLYINVKVNGAEMSAFVDTGAQMTILSERAARKAGLDELIDRRFQGVAIGVGSAPIVGRIHLAELEVGGITLLCSFTVMRDAEIDLIFGLDMLLKHECSLDFKNHVMCVANTVVPFLTESELPLRAHGVLAGRV
ncbi:unnamed protein product [Vitrella brassicaformis CCMP3155]|uniref:Aspartic peptidase DDI1-type domain-containing protein n=1 Tax=Vitrella brassicaformis (strain CCMP3155) TaxID=1169540 RepID=A0A0G4F1X2_VITBC|nr:unnamed protein product [Vitrella brassicaformis CCMP3155]|eukprot:CEM05529.1 unnamed protein product [Vitrella brassicaformis CCMP3155]